ncbi:MAG: histidinol-phosphate transaminase [Clostridia bacterium]|nr:histidinol-phosphate transaminase [Clostridia bacterium]
MSKFFSDKYKELTPYTPGEQPVDMQYIKLNTNESPFPPPASVVEAIKAEGAKAHLYSDPTCKKFVAKVAEVYGVKPTQVIAVNGSDEVLNFAFMAFCDKATPAVFPDITYGFYSVFAQLNGVPYKTIPLKEDFSVDYRDYLHVNATVFIANPNAPTGMQLSLDEIEQIAKSNPDNVVVIDEAYVDFGGESAVKLVDAYENLLVTQTFSKSRSLAGARLGIGIGSEKLIADLHTLRYSTNPYNVNRMTLAGGYQALCETEYYQNAVRTVVENREYTAAALKNLGFDVLPSKTNFLFVKTPLVAGETLYKKLKEKGVLVRHFTADRIKEFCRVTIGSKAQMVAFLQKVEEILAEEKNEKGTN